MNNRGMDSTSPSSVLESLVPISDKSGVDCNAFTETKQGMELLQQFIGRQVHECRRLDGEVLVDIANDAWTSRPVDGSVAELDSDWTPFQMLECALNEHLNVCRRENLPAFVRRKSFVKLNQLLDVMRSKLLLISSRDETDHSDDLCQPQHLTEESSLSHNQGAINTIEKEFAPPMDIDSLSNEDVRPQTFTEASSECNNGDKSMNADGAVVPQNASTPPTASESSCAAETVVTTNMHHGTGSERQQPAMFVNGIALNSHTEQFVPENIEPPKETSVVAQNSSNIYHFAGSSMNPHNGYAQMSLMETSLPSMYFPTAGLPDGVGHGYGASNASLVGATNPHVAPTPNFFFPRSSHTFAPLNTEKSVSVIAQEDRIPTLANTINARLETLVTFRIDNNDAPLDNVSILCRLNEWDPFWSNVSIGKIGATRPVDSTYPWTDTIATAAGFRLDTSALDPTAVSRKQTSSKQWVNEEFAILLRMIPLDYGKFSKGRADGHIWPKGTFLQINGTPINVMQRRQLRHNNEWTGRCDGLNIAPLLQLSNVPGTVEMFCYDDQIYVYCVCLSQYRSVDHVLWRLTKGERQERIMVVPLNESKSQAVSFAKSLVSIDIEDDDGCNTSDDQGKFIVSLKCPISKAVMQIPVRGRNCYHRQCFDLRSYLSINSFASGNRWRCACCELFVSVKQLEVCGLTQQFLQEFRSLVTWNRESVEFRSGGTYEFLAPRKVRRYKIAREIAIKLGANEPFSSDHNEINIVE